MTFFANEQKGLKRISIIVGSLSKRLNTIMSACSSDPLPLSPGSDYASERFPPHDPPPRHLPLTQLLMSMVRLRRVTFLKEKKLKISSCKKFVRSESEYVFHAFKGDFFSTPEMLWGVRMALFVRGLWRGFPVNLLFLTKHQLVGIFWWIVGRRLLCTLHWSACILEDQLDTFREHSDSDSD